MIKKQQVVVFADLFATAVKTFRFAIENTNTELERDGTIQRFEYCFELCWKCLKLNFEYKGYKETKSLLSPRNVLKIAFREDYFDNEDILLDMLEARNLTSHTYNERLADKVFAEFTKYLNAFEQILISLKKDLE